jgi:hypothetical protein
LSELDPDLNAAPSTFDMLDYQPVYWLINGEAYDDTDAIPVVAGDQLLIRYLNPSFTHHTMQLLGLRQRVIARDGNLLASATTLLAFDAVAETIPAGQTTDVLVGIPAGATIGDTYGLYNRQLHLTNGLLGAPNHYIPGGGMMTFLTVAGAPPPPTATFTPTPTDTALPDVTPTDTDTPTDTPTDTDTPTPTDTPTDTDTPAPGPTDTPTPTDTALPDVTPTDTDTPAPGPTDTPTPTDTNTPVPAPTDTPTTPPSGPTTLTLQVGASANDVNEDGANYSSTGSTVWLGTGAAASASYTGLRFTNVTIPPGATITSAYLEVRSDSMQWIPVNMNLAAEAVSDSPAFSTGNRPSQRTLTGAQVSHSSNVQWLAGTWYSLNDISSVIQEVVDQGGWTSGNSLSIIVRGTGGPNGRKFVTSYTSGAPANAPRLVITYTVP